METLPTKPTVGKKYNLKLTNFKPFLILMDKTQKQNYYDQLDQAHVWHPYTQMNEYPGRAGSLIVERGEGPFVFDIQGQRYIDGYAQMWCNLWGHTQPEINQAIKDQLDRIAHSSLFSASNVPAIELAHALHLFIKEEFQNLDIELPHVFFSDNGSTAVEVGLKMALQYHLNRKEKRTRFLTFHDAYHGDTGATMTLGGIEIFRKAYEPLTFEVLRTDYPMQSNTFDAACEKESNAYKEACEKLTTLFAQHGSELAAVVIEPGCQGAGGVRPCYPGFLKLLRKLCDQHHVLLICDEILTGFGRCGESFASKKEGVAPDILCLSKGLTAGYLPLAVTMARPFIYQSFLGKREEFKHLLHGHTFTGNQLGCAAALASLKLLQQEKLIQQLQKQEPFIQQQLQKLATIPGVGRIRHYGMMIGIPLEEKHAGHNSEGYENTSGHQLCARAQEQGLIVRPLGNVIVLMPVLATPQAVLGETFDILEKCLLEHAAGKFT